MFKAQKRRFGKFTKLKLINLKTDEYVTIIPEFGANINELVLNKNGRNFSIIDGDRSLTSLINNKWFKGAKLIPFPNRINNGEYSFDRKRYQLPINFPGQNHAIHGLLYNKNFEVERTVSTKVSIYADLKYIYEQEISGYPFHLQIKIRCFLTCKGFKCKTVVKNLSNVSIPLGDGWHPYFKTSGKVENLWLKLPAKRKIEVNKRMIPTGKKTLFDKFSALSKIGKHQFDTGFALSKKRGIMSTELQDKEKDYSIVLWQETGKMKYNYLQVFIPPARNSIALEPMTCNTNAFNNKDGLITLKPQQVFKACYGVYVK